MVEGGGNPRASYRDLLAHRERPAGALLGIGDVGEPEDDTVLAAYFHDQTASARAAAVRVVARHGGDQGEMEPIIHPPQANPTGARAPDLAAFSAEVRSLDPDAFDEFGMILSAMG